MPSRAVVLLAAAAVAAGCGGGDQHSTLALTDDTCTYVGDTTVPATETLEVEVANESSTLGAFELARIEEGASFEDVRAYVESERKRLADGLEIAGPPAILTNLARVQTSPGGTGLLVASIGEGEYVLWCAHDHPPSALFLIEPAIRGSD
jgi:hypothetical protein